MTIGSSQRGPRFPKLTNLAPDLYEVRSGETAEERDRRVQLWMQDFSASVFRELRTLIADLQSMSTAKTTITDYTTGSGTYTVPFRCYLL